MKRDNERKEIDRLRRNKLLRKVIKDNYEEIRISHIASGDANAIWLEENKVKITAMLEAMGRVMQISSSNAANVKRERIVISNDQETSHQLVAAYREVLAEKDIACDDHPRDVFGFMRTLVNKTQMEIVPGNPLNLSRPKHIVLKTAKYTSMCRDLGVTLPAALQDKQTETDQSQGRE